MTIPKRKRSRARRDKRFANKGIKSLIIGKVQGKWNMTTKAERAAAEGKDLAEYKKATAKKGQPVDVQAVEGEVK